MYYNPRRRRRKRRPERPISQQRAPYSGKVYSARRRRPRPKSYTAHVILFLAALAIIGWFAFKSLFPSVSFSGTGPVAGCPATPKSQYVPLACQAARDAGIDPAVFVRQINEESGFDPGEVSPTGAIGIAQFMPETAAGMGINPWDPQSALEGAAKYMARLQANFGGDYAKALAAYNAGSGTVQSAVARCGPAWRECIPAETQNYLNVIL
ncbi:MAG TPA: transglycosylase SLT domain-containing protein [Ktedonobacteraceae bacterium]|nr:transglycosylase SLT domain-containing protein [Ktedonobacteraceae bacterium]